jgi:hypothetical protein
MDLMPYGACFKAVPTASGTPLPFRSSSRPASSIAAMPVAAMRLVAVAFVGDGPVSAGLWRLCWRAEPVSASLWRLGGRCVGAT